MQAVFNSGDPRPDEGVFASEAPYRVVASGLYELLLGSGRAVWPHRAPAIVGGVTIQFRADFLNAFNRPWFAGPNTNAYGGSAAGFSTASVPQTPGRSPATARKDCPKPGLVEKRRYSRDRLGAYPQQRTRY